MEPFRVAQTVARRDVSAARDPHLLPAAAAGAPPAPAWGFGSVTAVEPELRVSWHVGESGASYSRNWEQVRAISAEEEAALSPAQAAAAAGFQAVERSAQLGDVVAHRSRAAEWQYGNVVVLQPLRVTREIVDEARCLAATADEASAAAAQLELEGLSWQEVRPLTPQESRLARPTGAGFNPWPWPTLGLAATFETHQLNNELQDLEQQGGVERATGAGADPDSAGGEFEIAEPHAILAPAPPAFEPPAAIQATARPQLPAAAAAVAASPGVAPPGVAPPGVAPPGVASPKVASLPAGATPPDRRRTCKACGEKGHFAKKCSSTAAAGRGSDSPSPPKKGPTLQQASGTSWLRPPPPSIPGAAKKQIVKKKGGGKSASAPASAAGNGYAICKCGKSVKRGSLTSHLETELHRRWMKQGRRGGASDEKISCKCGKEFKRSSYATHMTSDLHARWMLQPKKDKSKAPKPADRKGSRSRRGQESSHEANCEGPDAQREGFGEGEQEEEEEGKVVVAALVEGTQVFESSSEGELMEARSIAASLPELCRRAQQAAAAAAAAAAAEASARARLKQLGAKRRRVEDGDDGGGGEGESGESTNQ